MSVRIEFSVDGLAELDQVIKALPRELIKGGVRGPITGSLMQGAKPVLAAAQAEAPISSRGSEISWYQGFGRWRRKDQPRAEPGRLRRAIKIQAHKKPRLAGLVGVGVDPGSSRNDPNGAWYGHIVHAKNPFLLRAKQKTTGAFIEAFRRSLASRLERIAKRLGDENLRRVARSVKNLKGGIR